MRPDAHRTAVGFKLTRIGQRTIRLADGERIHFGVVRMGGIEETPAVVSYGEPQAAYVAGDDRGTRRFGQASRRSVDRIGPDAVIGAVRQENEMAERIDRHAPWPWSRGVRTARCFS